MKIDGVLWMAGACDSELRLDHKVPELELVDRFNRTACLHERNRFEAILK